jgi:uncharacterized membrane protein (UPF0127 family)
MMRSALLLSALAFAAGCEARGEAPPVIIAASVRSSPLELEVAADPEARDRGLMFRRTLPEGSGMLFVFPERQELSFWMRNTYLPLSIAFLDDDGRVVSIADMEPFDETSHKSEGPGRYAVEVPQGWFTAHGVGPGDVVGFSLPADVRPR